MIVKIISSNNESSNNFGGVRYNDNKISEGSGELMELKNFPNYIDKSSSKDIITNYFKSVSKQNTSIKKPQFHVAISTKGKEHSKEELAKIANDWMDKMGYGNQPYLVVYHRDTKNNHVHIVSTRVDKSTGMKIDHNFENLRSQTALREVLKETYGIDHEKKLQNLLEYKYSNISQFEKLLERSGFSLWEKGKEYTIAHHGVEVKKVEATSLNFNEKIDVQRKKQLYSILDKYKHLHSNKVFKVENGKQSSFHSELQKHLKDKFGIEIVFSYKDDKTPFGYTLIDNKTSQVFKGSDVMKMNELFDFTKETIDKKFFDILENYNITDVKSKEVVLNYLNAKYNSDIKDYMAFEQKQKVPYEVFDSARSLARNYIKSGLQAGKDGNDVDIIKHQGQFYMLDNANDKIFELKQLVGEKNYNEFLQKNGDINHSLNSFESFGKQEIVNQGEYNFNALANQTSSLLSTSSGEDEDEAQRKRKKRKR